MFLVFYDPEIWFEPHAAILEGSYVGHEAVTEWYLGAWEHFEVFEVQIPDIRDLGNQAISRLTR